MKQCSALMATLALQLVLTVDAQASDPWVSIYAETSCINSTTTRISVEIQAPDGIPENWTGWIAEREVLGTCVADVQVGGLRQFSSGTSTTIIVDTIDELGFSVLYRFWAIDSVGNRQWISWPQRTGFTQATCLPGATAQGVVTESSPGQYHLSVCEDTCWYGLSFFDNHLPAEAPSLVGQSIYVFGHLYAGLEGHYIDVTGWEHAPECLSVAIDHRSWSNLKARY